MIITYALPQQAPERFETSADQILIGRSPAGGSRLDLDLVSDLYVSHVHARLICESGEYWIEDLGSANGTWVDEETINERTRLTPDSEIKVGWTRISVHFPALSDTLPRDEPWREAAPEAEAFPEWAAESEEMNLEWVSVEEENPVWVSHEIENPVWTPVEDRLVDEKPSPMPLVGVSVESDPNDAIQNAKGPVATGHRANGENQGPTVITGTPDIATTVVSTVEPDTKTENRDPVDVSMAATVAGEAPSDGVPLSPDAADDRSKTVISVEPTIASEAPALPVAPPAEDETRGDIICITDATASRFALGKAVSAEDILTLVWRQLKAFNELSVALSSAKTLNELVNLLVSRMPGVIPNAQRGAVLMPDHQNRLLLKAHWPAGEHSVSMTWVKRAFETREPFIWALPKGGRKAKDTPRSALYYQVQSAIYAPLMIDDHVLGVMYVDNYLTHDAFSATDFELLKAIGSHVALFIRDRLLQEEREHEKAFQENLRRQVSPAVAGRVSGKMGRLQIGGERVNPVTILVSDVRSFTAMSARMAPHEVVRMLNEMFDAFVPIIFEYGGTVDKFVGDSVLAVFGSPEPDNRQWEKALRASVEMQQAVRMLGEGRRVRRLPVFDVGISIHSGEAIHGFIGSSQRMDYTVIGDTVNQASRLCDGAASGEVVISQSVYEHVYRIVEVRPKIIRTKHSDTEPDLDAYVVTRLK
ncbi:MAG: FHA domain-containing protein [Desulfobacterales bacterium]|nr:FHA domain-containing protein [Desulfobacterales bacterium]